MERTLVIGIVFSIMGYLMGSILFAPFFALHIKKVDLMSSSKDGNPGTANAFMNAGILCGTLALICDIGKGFLPVHVYLQAVSEQRELQKYISLILIFVMLAPVLGHAYSAFHHFKGGKCIAVSFGVLLGLLPDCVPVVVLAFFYILFSVLRIRPHGRRTFAAFVAAGIADTFILQEKAVAIAMWLIAGIVIRKHVLSLEQMEQI